MRPTQHQTDRSPSKTAANDDEVAGRPILAPALSDQSVSPMMSRHGSRRLATETDRDEDVPSWLPKLLNMHNEMKALRTENLRLLERQAEPQMQIDRLNQQLRQAEKRCQQLEKQNRELGKERLDTIAHLTSWIEDLDGGGEERTLRKRKLNQMNPFTVDKHQHALAKSTGRSAKITDVEKAVLQEVGHGRKRQKSSSTPSDAHANVLQLVISNIRSLHEQLVNAEVGTRDPPLPDDQGGRRRRADINRQVTPRRTKTVTEHQLTRMQGDEKDEPVEHETMIDPDLGEGDRRGRESSRTLEPEDNVDPRHVRETSDLYN